MTDVHFEAGLAQNHNFLDRPVRRRRAVATGRSENRTSLGAEWPRDLVRKDGNRRSIHVHFFNIFAKFADVVNRLLSKFEATSGVELKGKF